MNYDVIVVGGGTAGCACAYTLGKLGLKTLIIEKNSFLGGTMTSALVTPAMNTVSGDNTNFYKELTKRLSKLGGQATYSDGNPGWFNPELLKIVLDEMMRHAKVDVIFDSEIDDIIKFSLNFGFPAIPFLVIDFSVSTSGARLYFSKYLIANCVGTATGNSSNN